MPDPTSITTRAYEADARSWFAQHVAEDRAVVRRETYDRFARHVVASGLVLDLGCGPGLDTPGLAARGFRLIGLDVSRELLGFARSQPALGGQVVLAEMRSLPLTTGSVDGVWASGSVHHLPRGDVGAALREIARILRVGGVCFLSVEHGEFDGYVEQQDGVDGKRWYSYYQPGELRSRVEAAALTVVDLAVFGYAAGGFIALIARKGGAD